MSGPDNRELNPYAPPAPSEHGPAAMEAVGPSGLSTSNLRLARLYLGGALFFLTVGGAAAGLMRAFLWSPRSPSPEAYNRLFLSHGSALVFGVSIPALACGVGPLLIPAAMGGANPATARLALGGWALWILGVVALAVASQRPGPSLGLLGVALGVGLMGVHLGLACFHGIRRKTAPRKAAAVAFLIGLGWMSYECFSAAVAVGVDTRGIDGVFVVMHDLSNAPRIAAANAIMAITLGLHLLLRRRDGEGASRPSLVPVLYAVLGVAPALLLWVATSAVLAAASADIHFHDTYFEVARTHAEGSVVVLAVLAGAHAWFEQLTGRRYSEPLAILAAVVIPAGLFATTFNLLRLGRHGMPRRYASYLDILEPLHRHVGTAAAVTAAGLALLAASVLFGKRIAAKSVASTGG